VTTEARIAKLERAMDAENTVAWEYSLEQLLGLPLGSTEAEAGPPRKSVKPGRPGLEELISLAVTLDRPSPDAPARFTPEGHPMIRAR
jgi:hypothetical protein